MKRMCLLPALLITLVSVSLPILLRALAESTRQNELSRQETDPGAPKFVSFPSGDLTLHGFLYKPEGDGPFPAIIWNHGSEKLPGQQPELARFYTKQGFVFFTPHRHGQGRSPGAYIEDLIEKYAATEKNRTSVGKYVVKLQEEWPDLRRSAAYGHVRLLLRGHSNALGRGERSGVTRFRPLRPRRKIVGQH